MKYKAVIFDLDGTLLDTVRDLQNIANHTLHAHGFPTKRAEEIKQCVGYGPGKMIELALPKDAKVSEEEMEQMYKEHFENFTTYSNILSCPYDGILDMLQTLKDAGIINVIVSNKLDGPVQSIMEKYYPGLIELGVGCREGLRLKPEPDMVKKALEELHLNAEDCIYVGDSEVDIATGKNAGMPSLSVTWGFRKEEFLKEKGAEYLIHTPEEIIDFVLNDQH